MSTFMLIWHSHHPMLRLTRTPTSAEALYNYLTKPFVMVIEHFTEDCGHCLSKAVYPGRSCMYGTHEIVNPSYAGSIETDKRVRVFFVETPEQWTVCRQIVESFNARTILYAQTPEWEQVSAYIQTYNPLFQELIELSPTKKVYGIKLEDLKRQFNCKVAWENKDWICMEESEGEIPGGKIA